MPYAFPYVIHNRTLYRVYTGLPVFLTLTQRRSVYSFLAARLKIYQANFILFGIISAQNCRTLLEYK